MILQTELMKWKNGRGTTHQIYIYPKNASITNFEWRISSATFDTSGPFSLFNGYKRILVLLEGEEISLIHKNSKKKILKIDEPYSFSGDLETESEFKGKIIDFNLIYKENYSISFEVLKISFEKTIKPLGIFNFIFCSKGDLIFEEIGIILKKHETYLFEKEIKLKSKMKESTIFIISIL